MFSIHDFKFIKLYNGYKVDYLYTFLQVFRNKVALHKFFLYVLYNTRFSEKRTHFSHFPIFPAREGCPKNATHFNQVTVKSALNSRKIRQNL